MIVLVIWEILKRSVARARKGKEKERQAHCMAKWVEYNIPWYVFVERYTLLLGTTSFRRLLAEFHQLFLLPITIV